MQGYGVYDAKGKRFRIVKDEIVMNANTYVIMEQNHLAYIVELYAAISTSRAQRDFATVEESFRLCSNYEEMSLEMDTEVVTEGE